MSRPPAPWSARSPGSPRSWRHPRRPAATPLRPRPHHGIHGIRLAVGRARRRRRGRDRGRGGRVWLLRRAMTWLLAWADKKIALLRVDHLRETLPLGIAHALDSGIDR